ncbi:hypothetical protein [Chromobacterium violaceum]|uniref:hypothetical protein n=1 Tax=Chromobacterium violaceum TaxID=536 RepID=UPI000A8E2829|nr:hypothetical protein [Chromobacterium violaceum]
MKKQNNAEDFFKMMHDLGVKEKIITPCYADFIQAISIIFDLNKNDKKGARPRKMSESRSMSRRQTIHAEIVASIFELCQVEVKDRSFLKTCFLKFENMLSHLKSIPIYSPKSRAHGELCFFWLVGLPQIMSLLHYCRDVRSIAFARELLHYLAGVAQQDQPEIACVKRLKMDITELLGSVECPDFKIAMGRIDQRSFPKSESIESMLASLGTEIKELIGEEKSKEIVQQARFKLLAAKVVFKAFKALSKNMCQVAFPDTEKLFESHRKLCLHYVCNPDIDENNFDFLQGEDFYVIIDFYFESIGYVDPENLPGEVARTLGDLIRYYNRAFLPMAVLFKFRWDLERHRINESYIRQFEKAFLLTTKNYQYGLSAAKIAGVLLALKIQMSDNIPHQSLEPLAMVLMENSPIENELALPCDTPFGSEPPDRPYTTDYNVAKAIHTFNQDIRSGGIDAGLCNPLMGLDKILQHIFAKLDNGEFFTTEYFLPKTLMLMKPVKAFGTDLYDALKGINGLLNKFNLIELIQDGSYMIRAKTSLAGEAINRYLKLTDAEKIEILKKIDREQCARDLAEIQ